MTSGQATRTSERPSMGSGPPGVKDGRSQRSVRNFVIDARFQLKYTAMLVAGTLIICGVMGTVLYSTSRAVVSESQALIAESIKVSEITKMNVRSLGYDNPELAATFAAEAAVHDKGIEEQQAALLRSQRTLFSALFGGLAVTVLLVGLLGIYITHKVAGPGFKLKRLLQRVGDGSLVFEASLRKGDELQDVFDAFVRMVEKLRERQRREIAELDKAIALVHDSGGTKESIARVTILRDEMRKAFDD